MGRAMYMLLGHPRSARSHACYYSSSSSSISSTWSSAAHVARLPSPRAVSARSCVGGGGGLGRGGGGGGGAVSSSTGHAYLLNVSRPLRISSMNAAKSACGKQTRWGHATQATNAIRPFTE